eukprot:TRINITY_DN1480_c0_g3_i1.p1 TRINITY_DN1480_c0_g3~~TRINITY_DN1480_c0_g3_i1.p1  ORF type:complete len:1007 (+),score=265.88 TRINITY_DN1480_c0_g3_i1:257-3277(+)
MFMSKRSKNIRRRVGDDADDEKDNGPSALSLPIKSSTSSGRSLPTKVDTKKEKLRATVGPSLLSFGTDEDEEEGNGALMPLKGKKKTRPVHGEGHKLGVGDKVAATASAAVGPSTQTSGPGEYTKEKLAELAKMTKSLNAPKKAQPPTPAPETFLKANPPSGEPVIVLRGLLKPPTSALSGKGSGQGFPPSVGRGEVRLEMEDRLGLMGIGNGAEPGGITHIPDAAAIAAAKAKRERLRQAQSAPDYIPLASGGEATRLERGRYRESGLVRENEDDREAKEGKAGSSEDDDDDPAGRMVFVGDGGKAKKRGERGGRRGGAKDGVGEAGSSGRDGEEEAQGAVAGIGSRGGSGANAREMDEEDEEGLRWEEEQLRKGVGTRLGETAKAKSAAVSSQGAGGGLAGTSAAAGVPAGRVAMGGGGYQGGLAPTTWGFQRGPAQATGGVQQGKIVMQSLRDRLLGLREAAAQDDKAVEQADASLAHTAESVLALEAAQGKAAKKYTFVQEMRDYVANLCQLLKEKAPLIEGLEEHVLQLRADRAAARVERRMADNSDEMAETDAAVAAAMASLSRGAGTVAAAGAASAAAANVRDAAGLAPQLDEFGRDVNRQKRMETKRRQMARDRRKAKAEERRKQRTEAAVKANGSLANGAAPVVRGEGESSSEESESEQTAYESTLMEALATAGSIFGDAKEEFCEMAKVKAELEGWKKEYPESYRDAYVALSVPSLFAPFVRKELLEWDPLEDSAGFSSMAWYNLLFEYGGDAGEMEAAGDPDADLIPKLVEKVTVPILLHSVEKCWEPLSEGSTARAVAAISEVIIYVPAESSAMQGLMGAVRERLVEAVAKAQVPAWAPAVLQSVPSAGRIAAQRFGTAIRLLRNLAMWRDVLAQPLLEQLALDDLVAQRFLPHLRAVLPTPHDAVGRAERLLAALGPAWIGAGSGSGQISPKLAPLVAYLGTLAAFLESRKEGGAAAEDLTGLARRLKRMLVEVNEYDRARALAKTFQLREAI